jgi:glycosyltransferase involved in cell wall biosynthesis
LGATITFIAEQLAACAWYRCNIPGRALAGAGHDVQLADWVSPERLQASDVVIMQRPSQPASVQLVRGLRHQGKTVVIDMDDDLWNIHPSNPVRASWEQPEQRTSLEESIRGATLATAATPELAELMRPLNRNVVVLPNMLAREDWPAVMPEAPKNERLVIGWAGSQHRTFDLQLLAGVLERILDEHENVEARLVGMPQVPFREHPRIHVLPPVPIEEYPALLAEFDIGMAPVVDGRFNRCKSDLKFLEYSMAGVPTVASGGVTYRRSVRHGDTGFLARNPKDWLKYLSMLVNNYELRESMRQSAHAFAETRLSDVNVGLWEKAYGIK